ncbi:MAG: BamA/TamA family outer membrane protein [Ignavibacteriaceae bacterium]
MKHIFYLTLFFFLIIVCDSAAQTTDTITIQTREVKLPFGLTKKVCDVKPVIGLALSGGGARGLAQIGVLRAILEAGLKPELIVGTSMGSIIGGFFASGYSIDQLDSIAVNTDWNSLLSPGRETDRSKLFIDQKVTEDKAIFSLRLNGLTPVIPTSINDGQKLSNLLNLLTLQAPVHTGNSFDNLRYRFRAVCTDLVTGKAVVLSDGPLSQAMRASSSVSFFLSPVRIDSMLLVDGGLVANIPVDITRNLGADIVVAVNTTSNLHTKDELNLPWIVADQVVSIPMKILNEEQLANSDIIIQPELFNHQANDFSNIGSLIEFGYRSALMQINNIKNVYDSLLSSRIDSLDNNYTAIDFEPPLNEEEKLLQKKLIGKEKQIFGRFLKELFILFDSGNYEVIKYSLKEKSDTAIVNIIPVLNPPVSEVRINGVTLFGNEVIEKAISKLTGKPYNSEAVISVITEIINFYRGKGYSLAEISDLQFDKQTGILTLSFTEGKITDIIINGNELTDPAVIMREIKINKGSPFRYIDAEESLINLHSTRLFKNVNFEINKEDEKNILIINVVEKESGLLRVGFRADNENKAQLNLDIRNENLFGSGTELGLILFGGARNRSYVLEHKSNRIFNTYLTYKINAYYKFNDVFTYGEFPVNKANRFSRSETGEYRQIFYGASIAVGTQVQKFGNLIFSTRYQFDEIKNKNNEVINPYKIKTVSLKISTTVDTQDKYPYPQKGQYIYGFYETAQTILGGDLGYSNIGFEYKSVFSLADEFTVTPEITMGFADKTLPLSQQYSIGGQNSFFGMRDNEFRGRQLFIASLEYRYRLPFDIFFDTYLKLRYDLGSTWIEQEQIRYKDLRHGIGATISFDTPVGPADFSVGRSFLIKQNQPEEPLVWGDVLFYFSIGYFY